MTDGPVEISQCQCRAVFLQRRLGSEQTQRHTGNEQWKLQGTAKAPGFPPGTGARARHNSFQVFTSLSSLGAPSRSLKRLERD
jgi:hypothetical protein